MTKLDSGTTLRLSVLKNEHDELQKLCEYCYMAKVRRDLRNMMDALKEEVHKIYYRNGIDELPDWCKG